MTMDEDDYVVDNPYEIDVVNALENLMRKAKGWDKLEFDFDAIPRRKQIDGVYETYTIKNILQPLKYEEAGVIPTARDIFHYAEFNKQWSSYPNQWIKFCNTHVYKDHCFLDMKRRRRRLKRLSILRR